jgi:hypothetical protein
MLLKTILSSVLLCLALVVQASPAQQEQQALCRLEGMAAIEGQRAGVCPEKSSTLP